jgi:hypothetical protein
MKILNQESWDWTLLQDNQNLFLSVLCGTVGMYGVNVQLSESEIEQYRNLGHSFIRELAGTIRNHPSQFSSRHIQGFEYLSEFREAVSNWQSVHVSKP